MGNKIRLDKFLADMSLGTRSQVKMLISKGKVKIDGNTVRDSSFKIDTDSIVEADGTNISYKTYEYFMLNKPAGVVSATEDKKDKTVIDLIDLKQRKDLFPVGRLDKDTEGLLIITNDGELGHSLLSPKKHVDKTYYVETDVPIDEKMAESLRNGVDIGEEKLTMKAEVSILENSTCKNASYITIREGKFHQVKRMYKAVGAEVIYLKRISMASLKLDESLKTGEYRRLTDEEVMKLKKNGGF